MSNTKQPPQELVEKMKIHTKELHPRSNSYIETAEQCAQIAVQHAEEENRKIQSFYELQKEEAVMAIEENRELRENLANLVSTVDAGYMSHYEDGFEQWEKQLEEDILKAKQLLNKNEDGKE